MKKHFNYALFSVVGLIVGFGALFFFTLSAISSLQKFGNTSYYFSHQLFFGLLPAIIAGCIAYRIPLGFYKKWALAIVGANILAMFLVFIPGLGITAGGATRWLNIGGISLQPSEFLKLSAILYLAAWIASRLSEEHLKDWKAAVKNGTHNIVQILIPFMVFLSVISLALFLQSDAGTLGIISLTLLAVYFSARTPLWHAVFISFLGFCALLILSLESYRWDRWLILFNPDHDPLGKGFQVKQSIISLGSGGFWGRGLGMSVQKFGYIPQAMTDSIFAVIGEEIGFFGCMILIGLFIGFFWMGLKLYRESKDTFAKLTAIGIVFWICLQTFVNMAASMGLVPLTGIPLPFFSYGGSHLVAELVAVGILLNISKNS